MLPPGSAPAGVLPGAVVLCTHRCAEHDRAEDLYQSRPSCSDHTCGQSTSVHRRRSRAPRAATDGDADAVSDLSLPGLLRRIRRTADLSQRELARAGGLPRSTVAAAEAGTRGLDARTLARLAALAGFRLALLDAEGREVAPMHAAAVRDGADRHYPAHLDTRHGDEGWWHGPHRYDRDPVTYTFDRDRRYRDVRRAGAGTPEDHRLPQPGDALADRARARRAAARQAREEELARRRAAGLVPPLDLGVACDCPPGCEELDDRSGPPRHAAGCACPCDVS